MSKFEEFCASADKAINMCFDAAQAIWLESDSTFMPLDEVSSITKAHLSSLLDDQQGWQKNALELAFKRFLIAIVGDKDEELAAKLNRIFICLDIVIAISQNHEKWELVPFILLEDLMDIHTTEECEHLFDYIEKRKPELTKDMVPLRGKGPRLLRICSELLRRLSKETNTVFCGRILMFLASAFPLDTPSGVNKIGAFNMEPVQYDADEDVDNDPSLSDEQKAFYKTFWSIRTYFSSPPSILKGDNFAKLQEGADTILAKFQQIAKREEEISGASRSKSLDIRKRKHMTDDMEEDPSEVELVLREVNANFDFPRLLSSRDLLDLEMEDVRFRRCVMLQFLILFQYILEYTSEENEQRAARIEKQKNPQAAKVALAAMFTLDDAQEDWVISMKKQFIDLMKRTKPHGRLYSDIALALLAHERNWVLWKAHGCQPRAKAGPDIKELQTALEKRQRELKRILGPCKDGNNIIAGIYDPSPQPLGALMKEQSKDLTALEIIDRVQSALDTTEMRNGRPLEEQFDIANGALIQATRQILRAEPSNVSKIYQFKKSRYENVDQMTGQITERHLEAERLVLQDVKTLLDEKMQ